MRLHIVVSGLVLLGASQLFGQTIINSSPLPDATVNTPYSVTFQVNPPGSYFWGIDVAPPGLTLDSQSGTLSGSPTTPGTYTFTITASSFSNSFVVPPIKKTFQLTVNPVSFLTTSPLPDAIVNTAYSVAFQVSPAGSYLWSIDAPPPGLTLNPQTGTLTGSPTAKGTYAFNVTATPTGGASARKLFQLTVNEVIAITTTSPLPDGDVNARYAVQLHFIGGKNPFAWGIADGKTPAGLILEFDSGVIDGTPTVAGNSSFTVQIQDINQNIGTKDFTLKINPELLITTASPLTAGTVGSNYSQPIVVSGGAQPYTFAMTNAPPGLSINPSTGVISGSPGTSGTFPFNVTVTDNIKVSVTKPFQVTFTGGAPLVQISPVSLTFAASAGGDSPPSQRITILDGGSASVTFRVTVDAGQANTAAPPWLSVKPLSGTTPARLIVTVDQGSMGAGNYSGRIRITDSANNTTDIPVTLAIAANPARVEVAPDLLRFAALAQSSTDQEQVLLIRNSGGAGPLQFSTQVLNASIWISSVTPGSGQILRNAPAFVRVRIHSQGLQVGKYRDVIRVVTAGGNIDVPITLFVTRNAPILGVNVVGLRLQARQGGGFSNTQAFKVLNIGDPSTTVNWTAEVTQGGNIVTLGSSSGTATATKPGEVTVSLNASATQAAPGGYYALIRISDSKSLNSPQYVVVVLDLAGSNSPALPDPFPVGMLFTTAAGSPQAQLLSINTSSAAAVPFELAASTFDGANWLLVNPASGQSSGSSPGSATVSASTAGLAAGIYFGEVSIAMSGVVRIVNVALIVLPSGSVAAGATPAISPAASCAPNKLAITETGMANNFAVPAKWPATLVIQLNDDCGNSVTNGSVIASFSNGDAPLLLQGDNAGNYSATWQPGPVSAEMQVTLRASAGSLQPATFQLNGSISQNQAPTLARNGTLHNLNPVVGGALAPGTVAQVFGTGLASAPVSPGVLPLPTSFNGTFVLVAGLSAPLYFVSDGQVNIQIPSELDFNQPYAIIASANGALTLPDSIDLIPNVPGVAAFPDGHIIAQHSDFTLVDAAHPAKPGEFLVMYLAGLGATNPNVASGQPSPSIEPFARVTSQPTVMVDAQTATIAYAGLTPGFAGLYQINFQVPASARSGDLILQVAQNGQTANTTRLPVSQ